MQKTMGTVEGRKGAMIPAVIRAVIFDMDGVLLDTERYLVPCWCRAAERLGFSMKREDALEIRSLSAEYAEPLLKKRIGENFDYAAVRAERKRMMKEILAKEGIPKKPGVDELFDYLQQRGVKRAVATATEEERACHYLKEIGVYDKLDRVICTAMVAHGKPAPDVYRYACEQIGELPEHCLAVEDSPNGIRSAYDAGLRVIMVPDLTEPEEEISRLLVAQASSLGKIIEILEKER